MWTFIVATIFTLFAIAILYLVRGIAKIEIMQAISKGKKWPGAIISFIGLTIVFAILTALMGKTNSIIVFLHLSACWMIVDLILYIVKKISGKVTKKWIAALLSLALTTVYLGIGMYNAYHVAETKYYLTTDKHIDKIRVALFADSHISTLFDGHKFTEHMKKIEKSNPDVLVISGDFVDDSSKWEDVKICCKALGEINCTYGVYYSPGNHDRGYYNTRDFTYQDLKNELTANGVKILEDQAVLLNEQFYVIGRKDKSSEQLGEGRLSMDEMLQGIDKSKYMIVIDHQPGDCANESAGKVDLVLVGHTHGGQLFPGTFTGELFGLNELTYGLKKIDETNFVVTSGIADWELMFKTGCKSEYVIIDVGD